MSSRILLLGALCAALTTGSSAQRGPDAQALQLRIGFARPGGGYAIETLPLETYVARVLAGEAARESPRAALEALAITIRTYALANRNRHRADGFDVCDETHCQVLRAASTATMLARYRLVRALVTSETWRSISAADCRPTSMCSWIVNR